MSERVGPYWTDARVVLSVLEPGATGPRVAPLARPFGVIGRVSQADVRIDDRDVSARHIYIHIDARGVFAVDLSTRTGTRFGPSEAPCGWLRPGESIELAGRLVRLESLEIHGRTINPPPCAINLLADAGEAPLALLALEPAGHRGSSWVVGSELAIIGRGDTCAIRLNQANVSRTHCILLRTPESVFVIDLPGCPTQVNGQAPRGAVRLNDGDALTIGQVRFLARVTPAVATVDERPGTTLAAPTARLPATLAGHDLARLGGPGHGIAGLTSDDGRPFPLELVPAESRDAVLGWMMGVLHAGLQAGQAEISRRQDELQRSVGMILQLLREQTATRLDTEGERVAALAREIRRYEAEHPDSRAAAPPPTVAPPRPAPTRDVPPAPELDPSRSFETAAWLLERLEAGSHDQKGKFSFQSLFSRLSGRRSSSAPGDDLDPDLPPGDGPIPPLQAPETPGRA